jgi:hypothetical protein
MRLFQVIKLAPNVGPTRHFLIEIPTLAEKRKGGPDAVVSPLTILKTFVS